jgi:hypothetical protein
MNTEDLTFETRQDPKVVEKVLADLGFTGSTVETHSDEGGQVPPAEPAPATDAPVEPVAEPVAAAEPAAPPAPKPSSGYKKKWETTAAENERLKQELEAARKATPAAAAPAAAAEPVAAEPATSHQAQPTAAEQPAPKPKPEDYENGVYDPAFVEAIADWRYDERARIDREKVTTAARETEAQARKDSDTRDQEAFENWRKSQIDEAKARHDDFDVVIAQQHDVDITNDVMNQALWSFDHGAELAYWLATHPTEANKICIATKFNEGETIVQYRKKLALAVQELGKIELPELAAIAEDDDPIEETQPAAQPVAAVAAAAAAPAPSKVAPAPRAASPAPAPKPAPPSPVGSGARSTSPVKSLSQMTKDGTLAAHLAKFPNDPTAEFRRLRKAEYGN